MSLAISLLLLSVADAASRLVVTMEQSASLVIDGAVHPPAIPGQRVTINHIAPGDHTLEVRDPTGQILYSATVAIPESATVLARWSSTGGLVYEGDSAASLPPPVHNAPTSTNPYADVGSGSITVSGSISGIPSSPTTVSSPDSSMAAAGGADSVETNSSLGSAAGQVAQNIAYNAVPGGNIIQSVSGTGLGGAALGALQNSPAGTSLGSATPSKQIIKPDPEAILGSVIFYHRGATPLDVYVDGMYRGQLGPGETDRTFRIEIGQRQVEFWVSDSPLFRGELQVDQNVPVQLELSDVANPHSPNRSWAWADRY
ncbi:MAG: hypothetical protein ACI8RZ_005300 [Myxococcota bacterium]|jgi:hypothetical protein